VNETGPKGKGIANHVPPEFREDINLKSPELVSVVIPAFNAAATIRHTLSSVLAQTYQTFEVIVVDDGSSDGTSTIVEEFVNKDSRFQIVRQINQGVGAARNTGIRKARGKYVTPLDADDLWFPEKLEKQVTRLVQGGPETGLVYCWSKYIDEQGELIGLSPQYEYAGRVLRRLILLNFLDCPSGTIFRRAALEKVGPYLTRAEQRGAQGCEDLDLALRIAEVFNIGVVPEYLVGYRQARSSMSVAVQTMATSYMVAQDRARQRNRDLASTFFRWGSGYFFLYLAHKCYYWGYYSLCLRYLKKAAGSNPVLLLKTEVYRRIARCLLKIVTGHTPDQLQKQVHLSVENKESAVPAGSTRKRKRQFISNRIFRQIELHQWSAASQDRA
jgi:glycosyltransferase involved in cell wall biosynthesis